MWILGSVCVILGLLGGSDALSCWVCSGVDDSSCYTTYGCTKCASNTVGGVNVRSCYYSFSATYYCSLSSNTCCDTDFCNGDAPSGFTKCYSCYDTDYDTGLSDCPKGGYMTSERASLHDTDMTYCKGGCYKSSVTYNNYEQVSRGCSSSCTDYNEKVLGIRTRMDCCATDLCNGGITKLASMSLVILSLLLGYAILTR